jgi:large subunit ribosomal protein L28
MSKTCEVTGKKPGKGNTYVTRGIAKKKKGIGIKVTGKTKRRYYPNLVEKRLYYPEENRFITLKLSMHGLRIIDKVGVHEVVQRLRAKGQKV